MTYESSSKNQNVSVFSNSDLIPIGVSNRHLHLSNIDLRSLFGNDYTLSKMKDLTQKGQFACVETVTLVGPKGNLENVRILGPTRKETQIEISFSDSFKLGLNPPIVGSGSLKGTSPCTIIGPKGSINLSQGLMIAQRHIHMSPVDAIRFKVRNKDLVCLQVIGIRGVIFTNILVRVDETFVLDFHIDTDEANCAYVKTGDLGRLVKPITI